jgi:hypothetical protein
MKIKVTSTVAAGATAAIRQPDKFSGADRRQTFS